MMKRICFALLTGLVVLTACNSDDDATFNPTAGDVTVQNFMWQAMNEWYFWQGEVDDLADDRFSSDEEYTEFLQSTPDPEQFIRSILFDEDRFTFWRDDVDELRNAIEGISKSNGLQGFNVDLIADDSEENRFYFIRNVVPGSAAEAEGVKRGDVFWGVDGVQFTSSNFSELLSPDTYTLNVGSLDVENRLVERTDDTVTLTKEAGFQENPIRLATTLDVGGTKIGYFMFQRFVADFDTAMNEAFGQFKNDGVTDLVLDMRYNGGGRVSTAQRLSSLIYGPNTNDLFIRQLYNAKQQPRFEDAGFTEDFFVNNIDGMPINSLNLNRVYVLTSSGTASASELVINGLDPYIEVIQIGTTTRGKFEFSFTLVDDPENNYTFSTSRFDNINPNNRWALQPITGINENSVGFSFFEDGFTPDVEVREDVFNLGQFGDVNEPLLAKAIEQITNISSTAKSRFIEEVQLEKIEFDAPIKDLMIVDKPLNIK